MIDGLIETLVVRCVLPSYGEVQSRAGVVHFYQEKNPIQKEDDFRML